MRRSPAGRLLSVVLLAASLTAAPVGTARALECADWDVCLYVPAFQADGPLGLNVSTVLNLQIWHTLRRAPWPNPDGLDFGTGGIVWDSETLDEQTHRAAEKAIRHWSLLAQMTLWGKAYRYGDGVVVQPRLSLPAYRDGRETRHEVWRVDVAGRSIELDLPRRRYELGAIVLQDEVLEAIRQPDALVIYSQEYGGEPLGRVGDLFIGLQFHPDRALIRSDGITGWVRFPALAKRRTGIVDFVGGLVRVYRADWIGAASAMGRVIENPNVRARLRYDAHLLRAMALTRGGRGGAVDAIDLAIALNPYDATAIRYRLMVELARLDGGARAAPPEEVRTAIRTLAARHAAILPADDPWLARVLAALDG